MREARIARGLVIGLLFACVPGSPAATRPGLKLTLAPAGQAAVDARVSRLPALVVPRGETVSPFLEPGPFTATWSGMLDLPLRNRYRFHVEGTGRVKLKINGKPVLDSAKNPGSDWVRLQKGGNAFEAVYEAPNDGDAVVRLLWSSADHPAESISPRRWFHDKYHPPALRGYLCNPGRAYHANRMPNFVLSSDEANALAAFLLAEADEPPPPSEPGDADRGRQLVETAGCVLCHPLPVANQFTPPSLAEVRTLDSGRGCLSEVRGRAPDLGLSAEAIEDLKNFIESGVPSLSRHSPLEFVARQFLALQCAACHQRDGAMDAWTRFQDETTRWTPKKKTDHEGQPEPAQDRPALTWAGEKLVPAWTRKLLAGGLKAPARPWLGARMPVYAAHADGLARGLAYGHGTWEPKPPEETADPRLVDIGRTLVTRKLGFGCTDCHGVGEQPAVAVFEAEGVNFRHEKDRLRPEYYHRLLRDPTRIDPKTTMPRYGDAHGYTPIADVLDGDARRQFEAIRHYLYLLAGEAIQPPPRPASEKQRDVSMQARAGGDAGGEREPDWVDGRWQQMDNGPAVFHSYQVPRGKVAPGIAIRLGEPFSAAMIFDQERLSWRAGWTGEFLQFSDKRWGLLEGPRIAGETHFATPSQLGCAFEESFNDPRDGHLYLTGCDGWQTAAVRDGCFQRLRKTGRPFHLPVGLKVHENGIRVTFSRPLDPKTAEDPSAYAVERWNYRWTSNYGSAARLRPNPAGPKASAANNGPKSVSLARTSHACFCCGLSCLILPALGLKSTGVGCPTQPRRRFPRPPW